MIKDDKCEDLIIMLWNEKTININKGFKSPKPIAIKILILICQKYNIDISISSAIFIIEKLVNKESIKFVTTSEEKNTTSLNFVQNLENVYLDLIKKSIIDEKSKLKLIKFLNKDFDFDNFTFDDDEQDFKFLKNKYL